MILLIIGQIFLVGAIIKSDEVSYSDIEDKQEMVLDLEMKAPGFTEEDVVLDNLTEDQMPEPQFEKENANSEKPQKDLPEEKAEVKAVNMRAEEVFSVAEIQLNKQVKIYRKNQGGKLLRLRLIPGIKSFSDSERKRIESEFEKFSIYQTNKYTELLFAAGGRIGDPYIASSSSENIFRLTIPFQSERREFMVPGGQRIADGVTYYRDRVPIKKSFSDVHILRIEPFADSIKVFPVLANEGIAQKERLSSMTERYNAIAAINGAYFTSRGDPIGTLIINRRLISSPLYSRSVFGITSNETHVFGNPDFSGRLKAGGISLKINAVNQPRQRDGIVIYTPEYARSTLTTIDGVEFVIVRDKIVGVNKKDSLIPPDGVVVSAAGPKAERLKKLSLGDTIKLDYTIDKPWNLIKHGVCGGPRLVSDGKIDINGKEEKFSHSIIHGRHPRTAVALTFDGDLIFVVVDGRSKNSVGMNLKELAIYLRRLGARHAINLDGGGSSSMIIKGKIKNRPSDGCERRISNGILITES
ncbi:MAG: phosphodiester glycosidase family protein [Candidatus Rifleibacteriota bacterium]